MTPAELRDLDAQIHREVMGLHCEYGFSRAYEESEQDGKDWWNTFDGDPSSVQNRWSRVPNYTADIAEAWGIIESLCGSDFMVARIDHGGGLSRCGFYTVHAGSLIAIASREAAPLAICLAALAAVRTKQ